MDLFHKIRELFRKSIFNKLVIAFVSSIMIPVAVVGYISYVKLEVNTRDMYFKDNIEILSAIERNLQLYFEDFERLTYNAISSDDLLDLLNDEIDDDFSYIMNQKNYEEIVWNIVGDRSDVEGVYIVENDNKTYYRSSYGNININKVVNEKWYHEIMKSNGSFMLFGSHPQDYKNNSEFEYVLTVGRKIVNYLSGETVGIIFIDIKPMIFDKVFQKIDKEERNIIIADKEGKIIFDFEEERVMSNVIEFYPWLDMDLKIKDKPSEHMGNYMISSYNNRLKWHFFETVPKNKLLQQTRIATLPVLIISLVCIVAFISVSLWISNKIAKPIKILEKSMKKVEKGNLDLKVELNCGGEVESLANRFNSMLDEIKHLIATVYETQLRELDAEFKALQAQINPHFLYNTLESINSLASIKGYEDIPEMVEGLANMLRYTIRKDSKFVKLEDELKHVRNYIMLQALSYEDKFDIKYDISDEILDAKVVKLMLQPLVENSLYHGLEGINRKFLIKIRAFKRYDELIITVLDNGSGFDKQKLIEINGKLDNKVDDLNQYGNKTSIGLSNIHFRIQLLFGSNYGLSLKSKKGMGTSVRIVLPLEKVGEELA